MPRKKIYRRQPRLILFLAVSIGLLTACSPAGTGTPTPEGVQTQLLVTSPQQPLPVNGPVTVISQTEDAKQPVSHVELYALEWPSKASETEVGKSELLLRSDSTPFDQTVFTAYQEFIPTEPGLYKIKVVGYNKLGESDTTDNLEFEVK